MSIQEEIKAFVDGELSPEMTDQVRQEIERDPTLAQQVAHYRLMGDAIRGMATEPRVMGADEVLKKLQPRNWRQRLILIGVPASIALAVAVFFPMLSRGMSASSEDSGTIAENRQTLKEPVAESMASSPGTDSVRDRSLTTMTPPAGAGEATRGLKNGVTGTLQDGVRTDPHRPQFGVNAPATEGPGAAPAAPANGQIDAGRATRNLYIQGYTNPSTTTVKGRPMAKSQLSAQAAAPAQPARMVVENGTLEVVVDDVSRAQSEAMNYAKSIGGFASNSSLDKDSDDGTATAQLTLRVPVSRFETAMDHLKHMAKTAKDISAVHVTGEDVTGQYVDTTARLKELRAEEDSYVGMLRNTHHMDDTLAVKDRISDVRQQIESLEAQAATLKDTSALSTIEVTFHQREKPKPKPKVENPQAVGWADGAWADAKSGMASATQSLGVLGIYLFVYSPLWIPLAFLGWLGARKFV